MDLKDKIVLAHSGFFNKDSRHSYKENSKEVCIISTQKEYIGIIELDVRKSKDGVLYCYHGTTLQYHLSLKVPRSLEELKKNYKINTLEEILDSIPKEKTVFLDLKDKNIHKNDILDAFKERDFKEIILGNKSVLFLRQFDRMPSNFVKILNGNIFCNFYNLKKLKEDNYKYFEAVFPFQINKRIAGKLDSAGIEFWFSGLFFLNQATYWKRVARFGIKHISSDFI